MLQPLTASLVLLVLLVMPGLPAIPDAQLPSFLAHCTGRTEAVHAAVPAGLCRQVVLGAQCTAVGSSKAAREPVAAMHQQAGAEESRSVELAVVFSVQAGCDLAAHIAIIHATTQTRAPSARDPCCSMLLVHLLVDLHVHRGRCHHIPGILLSSQHGLLLLLQLRSIQGSLLLLLLCVCLPHVHARSPCCGHGHGLHGLWCHAPHLGLLQCLHLLVLLRHHGLLLHWLHV
mmetsp:Transcript_5458/g.12088  ORF Transcript_5458/g.12088 Transcript_5458/m.12088 type:complete len:230 (-) Transcript_5458:338-1027(-)